MELIATDRADVSAESAAIRAEVSAAISVARANVSAATADSRALISAGTPASTPKSDIRDADKLDSKIPDWTLASSVTGLALVVPSAPEPLEYGPGTPARFTPRTQ